MGKRAMAITAFLCTGLMACGSTSAHKKAYIAGSVSQQVVTEAHGVYSQKLNQRVDECDPEKNEKVTTEAQFDQCLGPYANNDSVVLGLEIYHNAAENLFKALKDPEGPKGVLREQSDRLLDAAFDLLDSIPEAQGAASQLKALVGR
jgi:hypothetical protein